jgi:hypothetical protein
MCHLAASPFFPCFAMMAPLHAIQTPRFISILISKKDLHHYHLSYSLLIVYCIFVRTAAAAWFKMWYISTCNSAECSTNDAVIWLADRICGTNPETCYARVCTTNLTYRNIQFIHHIESCLLSQNALQYTHFSQLCTSIPPQYIIHSCKFAKLNLPLISREHTRKKKKKKKKKSREQSSTSCTYRDGAGATRSIASCGPCARWMASRQRKRKLDWARASLLSFSKCDIVAFVQGHSHGSSSSFPCSKNLGKGDEFGLPIPSGDKGSVGAPKGRLIV